MNIIAKGQSPKKWLCPLSHSDILFMILGMHTFNIPMPEFQFLLSIF